MKNPDDHLIDKIVSKSGFNSDILPKSINISTIAIHCKINVHFNIPTIRKYLIEKPPIIEVNKKIKKNLYNQISIKVHHQIKPISVKLFKNGTIQATGCKSLRHLLMTLSSLFVKLNEPICIINFETREIIVDQSYFNHKKNKMLNIKNLYNFNFDLINTNFKIGYKIDRRILYNLIKDKMNVSIELSSHSGVNIKFKSLEGNDVTILIFQSGKIIITGGKTYDQIFDVYCFIVNFLKVNYNDIVLVQLEDL